MKKNIIITVVLFLIFVFYTAAVKKVDVAAVGPNDSSVGFSTINEEVSSTLGYNENWYKITKYVGILPFFFVAFYGFTGVLQLIKEKSLKGVDKKLLALGITYVLIGAIYVFFEKIIINYRPIIMDGELEASYPSSHTLLAIAICGTSLLISKYFIKNEKIRKIIDIFTCAIMLILVVGRTMSGVHWITDIIGGILISLFVLSFFNTLLEKCNDN